MIINIAAIKSVSSVAEPSSAQHLDVQSIGVHPACRHLCQQCPSFACSDQPPTALNGLGC